MKKHLLILCLLLGLVGTRASAYDIVVDGIYYNILSSEDKTCEVTSGDVSYSGDIVIPATVLFNSKTLSVTSIESTAFSGCTELTSVDIPNSVTSIGDSAFKGCTGLTSITIPNSVTSIGSSMFEGCTSLTSVDIPNSVTSIGGSAFKDCTGLTSITIPNSVTSIGESAFDGCWDLASVHITDLEAWCKISFGGVLSNPLLYANHLYLNGTEVKDLVIPNSVTSIGSFAFKGCTGLTSITIPNSVTSIGSFAFSGCTGLTSITIPNSVTSIGGSAFKGCTGLTSITIPNSVTSIGSFAFSGCTGLTSITIPNSVTSIGSYAFSGCTSLTDLTIEDRTTTLDLSSTGLSGCPLRRVYIGMDSFGELFKGITSLEKVTLGNNVTSIGYSAFEGCTGLTSITIPNSVTSIEWWAFDGCTSLTDLTIEDRTTTLDFSDTGLSGCPLRRVYIGMDDFGERFKGMTSLEEITLGNNVTSIGENAFDGCTGLTNVTIGNSVTSIGSYAFQNCSSLSILAIDRPTPPSVDANAFSESQYVKTLVLVHEDGLVTYQSADVWKNFWSLEALPAIEDGTYYLYNVDSKQFLSRGEDWGTRATVDRYGIPFTFSKTGCSLKFLDSESYLFEADATQIYTDAGSSTGFQLVKKGDGYALKSLKFGNYLTLAEGTYGHQMLTTTSNNDEATVWQFMTKAEHDAIVAGYVAENYGHVIAASGMGVTSDQFLDKLATYTATDMTAYISTARFAGSVGGWTYNEVRAQGGQPAYGTDFCELWQATGSYSQTITGLEKGIYKVTVQGFERGGSYAQCNTLGEKGYEITTATLSANGEEINLKSWYSDKSGENNPNSTDEAVAKFNKGLYVNELYVYVEEEGTLTLTLNKPGHVGNNWVLFNNFTLAHYGYQYVPVTNITLNHTAISMEEGCGTTLVATVFPNNATNSSVTWSSSDNSVVTVVNGIVTAVSAGTATITAKAGNCTATCTIIVEPTRAEIADGEYYLYNAESKQFLSRGEDWGTRATVDNYGIPFTWNNAEASLKFLDSNAYLFETDDNCIYTDAATGTGLKFVQVGTDEYSLMSSKSDSYLKLAEGTHGHRILVTTLNKSEAAVWQFKTKAEHDAIVAGYVAENYDHVIAASGMGVTSDRFLDVLATCETTDMSASIGKVGDWTYNEVRGQGGQPAYGSEFFCELWQATGYHTQTITGLEKGIYKVTVQGFERGAGYAQCNTLGEKGYEITTTYLKANDEQVNLKSWYSDKSDENNPNSTDEAVAKFYYDFEPHYMNELYVYVGEEGTLTLTLNKPGHVDDNWVIFSYFMLTRYEYTKVTGVTLDQTAVNLQEGATTTLTATVLPENATDKRVTWSSSNESVATVVNGVVTAVSAGTATITAKAGDITATCVVTVTAPIVVADGDYYLYNAETQMFFSRGENWGTQATVDRYGIPFTWNNTECSLKFLDSGVCLFETADSSFFTDGTSTGFCFVRARTEGYSLKSMRTSTYLKLAEGTHGHRILVPTENEDEAAVWQFMTKAEHDAIVVGYVAENYDHVIAASGMDVTSGQFLDKLATYEVTDMTASIGTARFAGNVGDWTYNEVRAQNPQPAYGTDFCELWQATGSYSQTITGLEKGVYKVTVQGFERGAGYAQCNTLGEKGYEITTAYLKANDEQVNLKSWYSGRTETSNPNSTSEAVAKFNEGLYVNELYVYVGEDGTLTLTLNKPGHVSDNWVLFNNFTLTRYDNPNAIEAVTAEKVNWPADIYDLTGRMIKKAATSTEGLQPGVYLVGGKKIVVK